MGWIRNWFSNMLELDEPFEEDGIFYRTVENFFQAMKVPPSEVHLRGLIAKMNPFQAKKFVKTIPIRDNWDDIKLDVMEYALRKKFAEGTSWYSKLLATKGEEIVETNNWHDNYWGDCVCSRDACKKEGANHLGKLLMKIRDMQQ